MAPLGPEVGLSAAPSVGRGTPGRLLRSPNESFRASTVGGGRAAAAGEASLRTRVRQRTPYYPRRPFPFPPGGCAGGSVAPNLNSRAYALPPPPPMRHSRLTGVLALRASVRRTGPSGSGFGNRGSSSIDFPSARQVLRYPAAPPASASPFLRRLGGGGRPGKFPFADAATFQVTVVVMILAGSFRRRALNRAPFRRKVRETYH